MTLFMGCKRCDREFNILPTEGWWETTETKKNEKDTWHGVSLWIQKKCNVQWQRSSKGDWFNQKKGNLGWESGIYEFYFQQLNFRLREVLRMWHSIT